MGKVDSTPPPINPYIEPEKENPLSLKHWCHVLYGVSCVVQIHTLIIALGSCIEMNPLVKYMAELTATPIIVWRAQTDNEGEIGS